MDNNKDFDRQFDAAFAAVAFISNRHIIDHLMRLGRTWDMDLESVILWGLVSHLSVVPMLSLWNLGEQPLDAEGNFQGTPQGVKLAELARIAQLPRETVRRKLMRLQELGKVHRDAEGLWVGSATGVDEKTRDFTRETVKRLLAAARDVQAALENPPNNAVPTASAPDTGTPIPKKRAS